MPIEDIELKRAHLERMLVTRMNAMARKWATKLHRPTDTLYKVYSKKHRIEVSYDVFEEDDGIVFYELKVRDDLTGRTVHHVTIPFTDDGNEAIPSCNGNGIVFSNNNSQATVFAESMAEFVRVLHLADRNRDEIVVKAAKLLPRQT